MRFTAQRPPSPLWLNVLDLEVPNDVAQQRVVGEIKTGKFPHGLRMRPNGREVVMGFR